MTFKCISFSGFRTRQLGLLFYIVPYQIEKKKKVCLKKSLSNAYIGLIDLRHY